MTSRCRIYAAAEYMVGRQEIGRYLGFFGFFLVSASIWYLIIQSTGQYLLCTQRAYCSSKCGMLVLHCTALSRDGGFQSCLSGRTTPFVGCGTQSS